MKKYISQDVLFKLYIKYYLPKFYCYKFIFNIVILFLSYEFNSKYYQVHTDLFALPPNYDFNQSDSGPFIL